MPHRAEDVTLQDCLFYVIHPATEARQCSYVEVVARGPQRPRRYVSHWWGEKVCAD